MSSIEKQITGDKKLAVSLEKFSVEELPMRLEPSYLFQEYHSEDVELSPTGLLHLEEERQAKRQDSSYVLRLGEVPVSKCYPFQYKTPEGIFQKKIYVFDNRGSLLKPFVERAFFTFEPYDNHRESQDKLYLRTIYEPRSGQFEFRFGLKDKSDYLAGGGYNKRGKLISINCHTGTIGPDHDSAEEPADYSGPYNISFSGIRVSRFYNHGGKSETLSGFRPFEEVVTRQDLDLNLVDDGKAARIRKIGNFLRIEAGSADKMDYPDSSATLPLRINARSVRNLLVSRDRGSLVELAEKITVAFGSEPHDVNMNTIPSNLK